MGARTRLTVVGAVSALLVASLVAPASSQAPILDRTMDLPERLGLVDPASGLWHLDGLAAFYFGNPGDAPFMGDWDCDSVDTPGLYRRSDGFVYLRNSNTEGVADVRFYFGNPGDLPLAGDFDGDGCDSVSLYRPSENRVYLINRLGSSGGGLGAAEASFVYGDTGDLPFAGDFDGDGVDEIGLHRPTTELVYLGSGQSAGRAGKIFRAPAAGTSIVAGDWDGRWDCLDEFSLDCRDHPVDTIAMFDPEQRRFYVRQDNSSGPAREEAQWGEPDWLPVSGRFVRHPADEVRDAMVGTWQGTASFTFVSPYDVSLTFRDDGSFTAVGLLPPFWYGPGAQSDGTFTVWGVDPEGLGHGELKGARPGDPDSILWLDSISVVGDVLRFSGYQMTGSPLDYLLTRVG